MTLGALSDVLAGGLFKQAWKILGHDEDASNDERAWIEVLLAATLQGGAIFAGVKAAVDRAGAAATRRMTATSPG
ncbi:DUF4235 domain-containing protein [Streptomyces sp. NPDC046832]|uniref:DUF4235 domain-containing protein n=1 Tax=Streptomyces sp. NPDC046832 TaxID=3155020 RepID=UPI003411DD14